MTFAAILQFIGGLGVFLFGMKVMSEGLQRGAGDKLRSILSKMTSSRFTGILTGTSITAIVQSSSATTVMVIGFVNAGLLTLVQAIGVIMGANIGTTTTAWIVAVFGFKTNISSFALPVVAVGLPMLYMKKGKLKNWGEACIGFGLLFLGLGFIKDGVPDLKSNPELFEFLRHYTDMGMVSILLFLAVGTMLTVVVQSSSAATAITITMSAKGWIPFPLAAAMVLGENIGTTITAYIASLGASVEAKRAARAHFVFNVLGVIWMLAIFNYFIRLVDFALPGTVLAGAAVNPADIPIRLSLFHTMFNIANTIILIGFTEHIAALVTKLVPDKVDKINKLKLVEPPLVSIPELNIVNVEEALHQMNLQTITMLQKLQTCYLEEHDDYEELDNIQKLEDNIDRMEYNVTKYLAAIGRQQLSTSTSEQIASMFHIATDLERIGDLGESMLRLYRRKLKSKFQFNDEFKNDISRMFSKSIEFLSLTASGFIIEGFKSNPTSLYKKGCFLESELDMLRHDLTKKHTEFMRSHEDEIDQVLTLLNLVRQMERIGDHAFNIIERQSSIYEN